MRKERDPVNDGTIPNLEDLIHNGPISQTSTTNADPDINGFHRNLMTRYFENIM